MPINDDNFEVFAVSVFAGSCSGAGGFTALDAMGEGPSLFKEDTAATSLWIKMLVGTSKPIDMAYIPFVFFL